MQSRTLHSSFCRMFSAWSWLLGCCVLLIGALPAGAQVGDVTPVHDPSVMQVGGVYYLFCTGRGIPIRTSVDLFHWQRAGTVFAIPPLPPPPHTGSPGRPFVLPKDWHPGGPAWTHAYSGGFDSYWAPDISFFAGQFHLYYAASTFGQTHSAIGLATSASLDASSPGHGWTDRGLVVATRSDDDYNAIDPAVFCDADGRVWMVFGSCWSGIKLVELNPGTGLLLDPTKPPLAIAHRPSGRPLEEGYLTHRGGWYYLWASYDHCCRGAQSDYRIVVSRAKAVTGPYVDRAGNAMLEGGGTPVMSSQGAMRGPGSCAVCSGAGREWLFFHFYDADHHGRPTLQIRPLVWDASGWPSVDQPIAGPVGGSAARAATQPSH